MPAHIGDIIRYGLVALFCLLLLTAAVSDIRTRRIPNWTVLAVMALAIGSAFFGPAASFLSAIEGGAVALAVTLGLYAFGIVGAGDSKLFSAVALFVGLQFLAYLAVITALAGGVLAIITLILNPVRALAIFHMRGKGKKGEGIPYGVAIALGGIAVAVSASLGKLSPGVF